MTAVAAVAALPARSEATDRPGRPNVVLIMTDDQGYGDLACHGNPVLKTPALDKLQAESVRLTGYHVDPTCSPTRAALMTGRYSSRTGVWHTIMGRSLLHPEETTLADLFSRAGYRTGIFGKWHLGDGYPLRPQDRGFQDVLIHGGGGVGQTPDYWGNDYVDDTYFRASSPPSQGGAGGGRVEAGATSQFGTDSPPRATPPTPPTPPVQGGEQTPRPKRVDGYCTDVWFDHALRFITENKDRPFFCYLPTNAAHAPFVVPEKYSRPYKEAGIESPRAEFYGMIANLDENVARLRARLDELGLAENTVFIFTTDNGTAAGARDGGFNAGVRGTKGSEYDGGHRVPCFIHWPGGGWTGGRDIDTLTAHIDWLPTLIEVCRLETPKLKIDGTSLVSLLAPSLRKGGSNFWPQRTLFVHSQRIDFPEKWRQSAVMTDRWRLINGKQLYDIQADPGQQHNIAQKHPQVVAELRTEYDAWWNATSTRFDDYVRLTLGSPASNPAHLTCHDWHAPIAQVPWNQSQIERDPLANGVWAVEVDRPGRYEITLRTRPAYIGHPIGAAKARVKIGNLEAQREVQPSATEITIPLELNAGPAMMQTWLEDENGKSRGAYFVEVRRVE